MGAVRWLTGGSRHRSNRGISHGRGFSLRLLGATLNEQLLVDEFAVRLVREVRDRAIQMCDAMLRGQGPPEVVQRWAHARADGPDALAHRVIADCVDETLGYLLVAIDEGILPLTYRGRSGASVDLAAAGDEGLAGAYLASGGWVVQHSRERCTDDFGDLG